MYKFNLVKWSNVYLSNNQSFCQTKQEGPNWSLHIDRVVFLMFVILNFFLLENPILKTIQNLSFCFWGAIWFVNGCRPKGRWWNIKSRWQSKRAFLHKFNIECKSCWPRYLKWARWCNFNDNLSPLKNVVGGMSICGLQLNQNFITLQNHLLLPSSFDAPIFNSFNAFQRRSFNVSS